jgi:hypothetical protein
MSIPSSSSLKLCCMHAIQVEVPLKCEGKKNGGAVFRRPIAQWQKVADSLLIRCLERKQFLKFSEVYKVFIRCQDVITMTQARALHPIIISRGSIIQALKQALEGVREDLA